MGFLDDLSRERKREAAREEARETAERLRWQRQAAEPPWTFERKKNHALQMASDSGLQHLLDSLKGIAKEGYYFFDWKGFNYAYTFYWRDRHGTKRRFEVHIYHNGSIHFKSGFLGSSRVSETKWRSNRDSLEKALGKAYRNSTRVDEPHNPYRAGSRGPHDH